MLKHSTSVDLIEDRTTMLLWWPWCLLVPLVCLGHHVLKSLDDQWLVLALLTLQSFEPHATKTRTLQEYRASMIPREREATVAKPPATFLRRAGQDFLAHTVVGEKP